MIKILIAVLTISALAAVFGILLGFSSVHFKVEIDPLVDKINTILPQAQCGQCGYLGCLPYAQAIANGDEINKCPPGGQTTIEQLANFMGIEITESAYEDKTSTRNVAFIHEDSCIGCTKCIQICPIDAIIGSTKAMHTIMKDECTGCDLCVAPCPTDCIEMIPMKTTSKNWKWQFNQIHVVQLSTDNTKGIEQK
ncbi:electron transport complex subunit RsxB [Candidatus Enterovibrio escicola]|uniref:electron transport complex subunit RsxB n=1 Tax=Candidatus Enterovibrio escicola TaxID=1927127 RepID=UPI001237E3DE|nr:electron transport complex subunit RsxB [Candidatus Enterovibrio escacola]